MRQLACLVQAVGSDTDAELFVAMTTGFVVKSDGAARSWLPGGLVERGGRMSCPAVVTRPDALITCGGGGEVAAARDQRTRARFGRMLLLSPQDALVPRSAGGLPGRSSARERELAVAVSGGGQRAAQ